MTRPALLPLLALAASAALALGCGRPFEPATPPGFVDLGDRYGDDEYRATTAEGVVLGVRAFENDPEGDLAFWSRVIENRMRENVGYALLGKEDVRSRRAGVKGVLMRFGHDEGKVAHIYYLAVFVTEDWVHLVEAGGTKDQVERHQAQIAWAVRNFLPD